MSTPHQLHQSKKEKILNEKYHVKSSVHDLKEHIRISQLAKFVAAQAADELTHEDGFFFKDGVYVACRKLKDSPGMITRSFCEAHIDAIRCCCVSNDNKYMASMSPSIIHIWDGDPGTQTPIHSIPYQDKNVLFHLNDNDKCMSIILPPGIVVGAFHPQNSSKLLYCQGTSPKLLTFSPNFDSDGSTTKLEVQYTSPSDADYSHDGVITCCSFQPDGNIFVTGSVDSTCILWSSTSLKIVCIVPCHESGVQYCGFALDGKYLLTTNLNSMNPTMRMWDLSNHVTSSNIEEMVEANIAAQKRQFDRSIDAIFSPERTLNLLNLVNHIPEMSYNDDWSHFRPLPKDRKLPLLYERNNPDGYIKLIEKNDELSGLESIVDINVLEILDPSCSTNDPECQYVSAYTAPLLPERLNFHLKLQRRIESKRELSQIEYTHHSSCITCCAFSNSSSAFVSVSADKSIRIWDTVTGKLEHLVRNAHDEAIFTCAISPLDTVVATAGSDTTMKIWEFPSLSCKLTLRGHWDTVYHVSFDRTGNFVYSGGADQRLVMWRVVPGAPNAPKQPVVLQARCHSIDIQWSEPLGNGSAILKYIIQTFRDGEVLETLIDYDEEELKKSVDHLDPGVVYSFCIAAMNMIGTSSFSIPTIPIETLAYKPSALIRACTVTNVECNSVQLEWIPPNRNGADITTYHIKCIPELPTEEEPIINLTLPIYEMKKQQSRIDGTINFAAYKKPKIYSKKKKSTSHRKESVLKQQQVRRDALRSKRESHLFANKPWKFGLPKCLLAGTIYQFQLAAENRCGIAEYSQLSSFIKTTSSEPNKPNPPIVQNVKSYSVDVVWLKPRNNGAEMLHYTLKWKQGEESNQTIILARSLITLSYTITGLRAGQEILVWVSASNFIDKRIRDSLFSDNSIPTATLPDVPDVPTPPIVSYISSHSIELEFQEPCDNGERITSYNVVVFVEENSYGIISHTFMDQFTYLINQLQCSRSKKDIILFLVLITKLQARIHYVFHIAATNKCGTSDPSAFSMTALTKSATPPAALRKAPNCQRIQPTSVELSWTTPVHDGGNSTNGFIIEYSKDDNEFGGGFKYTNGCTILIDFLKPKHSYRFRASAYNDVGTATFSPPSDTIFTPTLVEYTLYMYFTNRPIEEHTSATRIQKCYRAWQIRRAETNRIYSYLKESIRAWNLL